MLNHRPKNKTDNEFIGNTEHLIFHLQNHLFSGQFTFHKNEFSGSLIILNDKLNKTLCIEYHTEKKDKRKKSKID